MDNKNFNRSQTPRPLFLAIDGPTWCGLDYALLSRERLTRRWGGRGSPSTFWRLEKDGLLVPKRRPGRVGYAWRDVWECEGGLPPEGFEEAYCEDLIGAEVIAAVSPLTAGAILARAQRGEIPSRTVGRFRMFVPEEARRWLRSWK